MKKIFLAAIAICVGGETVSAQGFGINAAIVDRSGNRHEVRRLNYQGSDEFEIYIGNQRRILKMHDIDRLTIRGDKNDEEQSVVVSLRTGEVINATLLSGGGSSPHMDSIGGGTVMQRFEGVTELGPFLIRLTEVGDIIFRHQQPAEQNVPMNATVITESGERFEVTNLRYRGNKKFEYSQGLKSRSKDMARISRLDFSEAAAGVESRTVTITFRSGRTVQGTVDASTVRLAGETDRIYAERVGSAFTGRSEIRPFAIGLNEVKLVRFDELEQVHEKTKSGNVSD